MFFKSLQVKMILIFFCFIMAVILVIGAFSVIKMEQVYYRGFVEEMINTISSFGINFSDGDLEEQNLQKVYDNFSIYFSLNNISRTGMILDKNSKVLFSSKNLDISDKGVGCVKDALASESKYAVYNDFTSDYYLFAYVVDGFEDNDSLEGFVIYVMQSKEYISQQIKETVIIFGIAIIIISFITVIIALSFSSNITVPIENIRAKVEMIADGDIDDVELPDSKSAGYEISRLVDAFNLMTLQIKENLKNISSERNKLSTILLHLTDGVLAFNLRGEMIHANLEAKKMLDISGGESFEQIFSQYKIDINLEKIIYLDDWTSSEQMVNLGSIYANLFFAPYRDEQDRPDGIIVVIQDITKQAKLDDMRKEFVANVSHELKTPLTSIKTYTETMIDEELDLESRNKFLNVILTEANRMTRLVSDLLQLTKFDYKKVAWNKVEFELPTLVKQICEKHKIQADSKNQILDCFVTSTVPNVFADRDGIEQVVTNILTNAIKYTSDGGSIKVYVGAVHNDAYIKIIDNGIGIPEEDLPRVFERFYRVDKARSREMGGTGLGLPIAKEIIEANGGSISMKSKVNEGTEVVMKIPCK